MAQQTTDYGFSNLYSSLADKYGKAFGIIKSSNSYYYEAVQEIVGSADREVQFDLLDIFYDTYKNSALITESLSLSTSTAIITLQNYVLLKTRDSFGDRYNNVSQFLDAGGKFKVVGGGKGRQNDYNDSFQISPEFAQISNMAGYSLDNKIVSS